MARRRRRFPRVRGAISGAVSRLAAAPRAVRPVIVRVAGGARSAGRRVRGGISNRNKSFNLKQVAAEAAVATLGGGASAVYDAVTDATANKVDDNRFARPIVKTVLAAGIKWLGGGNRYARIFADGWTGDTAGSTLRKVGEAAAGK